jgi:hypothetical protein
LGSEFSERQKLWSVLRDDNLTEKMMQVRLGVIERGDRVDGNGKMKFERMTVVVYAPQIDESEFGPVDRIARDSKKSWRLTITHGIEAQGEMG